MTIRALPTELICEVLSHTSPVDVVRWRTVSKQFCTITHDPTLWKTLYANAHYSRPPGPFPTVSFERAFVRSAQLAQLWTTQDLRVVSRISVPFDGWVTENAPLIDGRWLVVCQMRQRFVLYDTDAVADAKTRAPRVLWEQREEILSWHNYVTTSEEGQRVVYVFLSYEDFRRWRLLEFRLDVESGALCDTISLDVPVLLGYDDLSGYAGPTISAHSPFLVFPYHSMVFDTRTRTLYRFPKFRIALDTTRPWPIDPEHNNTVGIVLIIPTNTHVIVLRDFANGQANSYAVIQAFVIPDDRPVEGGEALLRLSHEGIFSSAELYFFIVIRNSVVDPVTGDISVRLVERWWFYHKFPATCIDLKLAKPSEDAVSPITIDRHDVLMQGDEPTDADDISNNEYYDIDISNDGYARGLFVQNHRSTRTGSADVVKFTIDATQDRCVVVLRRFSAAEWDAIMCPIPSPSLKRLHAVLDGVRGRLSYVDKDSDGQAVIVADIE